MRIKFIATFALVAIATVIPQEIDCHGSPAAIKERAILGCSFMVIGSVLWFMYELRCNSKAKSDYPILTTFSLRRHARHIIALYQD